MVHHDAAVLDDLNTGGAETFGRRSVFDSQLHPDRPRKRTEFEDLVYMCSDLIGGAEKVDNIDGGRRLGECRQTWMSLLAENLGQLGIDGNDPVPVRLHVKGDPVGVVAFAFFDSNDRDGVRGIEELAQLTVVLARFQGCVSPGIARIPALCSVRPDFLPARRPQSPCAGVARRQEPTTPPRHPPIHPIGYCAMSCSLYSLVGGQSGGRFLVLVAFVLQVAGLQMAGAGAALAVDDPAARLQKTILPNGLTILTLEDHNTPVVSFQMWVRAGSKDETFYTGIAHLFEHMMFKGSKRIAPEEHARLVGARGGRINAYTSRDVTVYHEDVTAESLPLVLALEAERVKNLDISAETLTSEREVVLEERRMRTEDRPGGLAFEALAALSWQAHPYHWPVIGWRADIEAVTVEACRDFFETYYSANNIVLVIVGDFDTAETLALVEQEFGGVRRAEAIPRNPGKVVEQRGERRSTIVYPARIPLLYGAWHAPKAGHPDGDALDVASQILSAGRSSRLYRRLVYENEQALYAEGGYWALQEAGLFFAVAGVRPGEDIDRVEALFFAEIDRMADEEVGAAELEKAKRQLEVGLVKGLATSHSLAGRIGNEYVFLGRVRSLDERLAGIQAVTAADVKRVIGHYLVKEKRSVVQVVPPPETAASPIEETP